MRASSSMQRWTVLEKLFICKCLFAAATTNYISIGLIHALACSRADSLKIINQFTCHGFLFSPHILFIFAATPTKRSMKCWWNISREFLISIHFFHYYYWKHAIDIYYYLWSHILLLNKYIIFSLILILWENIFYCPWKQSQVFD